MHYYELELKSIEELILKLANTHHLSPEASLTTLSQVRQLLDSPDPIQIFRDLPTLVWRICKWGQGLEAVRPNISEEV